MAWFEDIFKKKTTLYNDNRKYALGAIGIGNTKYSAILIESIIGQIFNAVETIEIWQKGEAKLIEDMGVANARAIITAHFREIFFDMFDKGYFVLLHRGEQVEYLPAKYVNRMQDGAVIRVDTEQRVDATAYLEKSYEATGITMRTRCQAILDYIDNILNTAVTGNAKLGNLIIFTPPMSELGRETMSESEKEKIEHEISTRYGGLDTQSNLMLFPQSIDIKNVSFDFGKLQLLPQLEMATKILCGYLNVPYDILPLSGQSTFNNQENAYSMLYVTAERWVYNLQNAFADLGVDFDFALRGKPNTEASKLEQTKKDAIATMTQAVTSGLMTIEEARKELQKYYEI